MKGHFFIIPTSLLALLLLTACQSSRMSVYSAATGNSVPLSGGIMYALPSSQIQVLMVVEYTDPAQAPYQRFAQEMLTGDFADINNDPKQPYQLKTAQMSVVASPNKKEIFYVEPGSNALYVDGRGILLALNTEPQDDSAAAPPFVVGPAMQFVPTYKTEERHFLTQDNSYQHIDSFYTRLDNPGSPGVAVGKADRKALRDQAASAAQQIKVIEEKQQQLLFGEYEGSYNKDGIQYLYDQLENMKQTYLQLFIGKTRTDSVVCYLEPNADNDAIDSQQVTLCWFSPTRGLQQDSAALPADALPITCTVTCNNAMRRAIRANAFRIRHATGRHRSAHCLRYRLPQEATVTLQCNGYHIIAQRIPIMQYGAVTLLPYGKIQARFDRRTGALIYCNTEK